MVNTTKETAARLVGGKFVGSGSADIDSRIQTLKQNVDATLNSKLDVQEFNRFLQSYQADPPSIPTDGSGATNIVDNGDGTATIGSLVVPVIDSATGKLTGAGLQSVPIAVGGRTYNVVDFGADPTGEKDCTQIVQTLVDRAHDEGGGAVYFPGGRFRLSFPFIHMRGKVTAYGSGIGSTYILVDTHTNENFEETGVFHTGTYNHVESNRDAYRIGIHNMTILKTYTDGKVMLGANGEFQHVGVEYMNPNIWGICFNTFLGTGPADPDAVHQVSNLEIWDMAGGIAYLGLDDQGIQTYNVRIRRTLKQAALVGKPFEHPEAYEVNPNNAAKPYRRTGAADNKFFGLDASGGNLGKGGYAGVEVYTSQCKFFACTSWYSKRYRSGAEFQTDGVTPVSGDVESIWNLKATTSASETPGAVNDKADGFRFTRDGAGWYITGMRNMFVGCTAQENGGHGFVLVGGMAQLQACIGESSGYYDTSNDAAKPSEAANFLITNWSWDTALDNCRAHNAYVREQAAKYGYYIQDWCNNLRLQMSFSYNMPFKKDKPTETWDVRLPDSPGENVVIEVNSIYVSTLARDQPKTPAAEFLTPSEIPGLFAAWDFSDKSSTTASAGRVSAVTATGKADQAAFTLTQADATKQPWVSAINGRTALKVHNSPANEFLQTTAGIGTIPAATGYTIAMVATVNSKDNGQYLWSSAGGGSTAPVSITVTEMMGLRGNTGGGSAGTTVKSVDAAIRQFAPHVIILTVTSGTTDNAGNTVTPGLTLYVDGQKYNEVVGTAGTISDFNGSKYATVGAYYGGTSAADATIGETAIFSGVLNPNHIKSLTAHLQGKWAK